MNLSPDWNNMGKQDFSCQKWLEQGGGEEREREGIVCPGLSGPPPPFPLPSNPPTPQRYRGDPRLQPPWWREVGGGRGVERSEGWGRVRGQPGHSTSVVRKTFRRVDGVIPT